LIASGIVKYIDRWAGH